MGTEREFYERGDFDAAKLAKSGPDHICTCGNEQDDPRSLRGEDLPEITAGWVD